jgi:uncharacterized membrane protein YdjX (TVP38/TMEM64 family)
MLAITPWRKPVSAMTQAPTPAPTGLGAKLPILLILGVAILGAVLLRDHLSFETLAQHRQWLLAWTAAHPWTAPLAFMAAYALIVAFSLPGATVATLAGGFLFATFPGVLYNVIGATIGATAIFLAARTGFGASLAGRIEAMGGRAARLQQGLRENEWSVLFLMRLVPAVPFFIANLLPAFMNVRLSRFVISTCLGILPGALVFTSVGAGLGAVFDRGGTPDLSVLTEPFVLLPLLGLSLLAALPLILKAVRK